MPTDEQTFDPRAARLGAEILRRQGAGTGENFKRGHGIYGRAGYVLVKCANRRYCDATVAMRSDRKYYFPAFCWACEPPLKCRLCNHDVPDQAACAIMWREEEGCPDSREELLRQEREYAEKVPAILESLKHRAVTPAERLVAAANAAGVRCLRPQGHSWSRVYPSGEVRCDSCSWPSSIIPRS